MSIRQNPNYHAFALTTEAVHSFIFSYFRTFGFKIKKMQSKEKGMQTTPHCAWIDYAKFVSIFFVVCYHCPPPLTGVPAVSLNLFRMSCFFFLSGLLFRPDKYPTFGSFAQHRSKQLLIPYFSFFALFYIYWLLGGYAKETPGTPLYAPLLEYVYGRPMLVDEPLWFVACLFAMQMLFYLLFKRIKSRKAAVILLLALPFLPVVVDVSNAPWMLENVCTYFPFYGIASLYRTEIMQGLGKRKIQGLYGVVAVSVYAAIVYLVAHGTIHHAFLSTGLKMTGSFCILFPVFLMIKYVADFCGRIAFTEYIATNAIVVLALHTYVIIAIADGVSLLGYSSSFFEGKYLLKFLISLFTVGVMVAPISIIHRYFPFILGKRAG
jgi:fucose 4-O-acetylase-like acetyltransferase